LAKILYPLCRERKGKTSASAEASGFALWISDKPRKSGVGERDYQCTRQTLNFTTSLEPCW
jgi:hypothetical protein